MTSRVTSLIRSFVPLLAQEVQRGTYTWAFVPFRRSSYSICVSLLSMPKVGAALRQASKLSKKEERWEKSWDRPVFIGFSLSYRLQCFLVRPCKAALFDRHLCFRQLPGFGGQLIADAGFRGHGQASVLRLPVVLRNGVFDIAQQRMMFVDGEIGDDRLQL